MSVIVKGGGGENVKAEVEYQTPVITQILEGLVGKAQGANATADKILEGYSAYVGQVLLDGTAKDANTMVDLLEATGCTKMAVDKIIFAGDYYADNREITHTLGVIPKIALLVAPIEAVFDGTSAPNTYMPYILGAFPKSGNQGRTAGLAGNGTNGAYVTTYGNYESTATTSTVKFRISDSSYYYRGGVEYTLITMA